MKPQLDYVQYSIDVLQQEEVDLNTKEYAIATLKKRVKELAPLFTECSEKGIDMQELCPELNSEWNTIVMLTRNI